MFKWFKKKDKQKKIGPEQILNSELDGLVVASMQYVVGIDGTIYLQFSWDDDVNDNANEAFSALFSQINSGDLLEQSMIFIEETLREQGQEKEFRTFYDNVLENQRVRIQPILDSLEMEQMTSDEVVVKPTDIIQGGFRGDQT